MSCTLISNALSPKIIPGRVRAVADRGEAAGDDSGGEEDSRAHLPAGRLPPHASDRQLDSGGGPCLLRAAARAVAAGDEA